MTTPTRITITADDVRELLRQFDGWEIATGTSGGNEGWGWHGQGVQLMIPVMPDAAAKADYQTRLWDAVRGAGLAMGIGADIYVHLGMMLASRPKIYLHGWLEKERRAGRPLPDPAWEPGEDPA